MTLTSMHPECTCGHPREQHRLRDAPRCQVCGCWGYSHTDSSHFWDWSMEDLRRSIGARRRNLALGYPSARMQARAREVMEAMEQALAERYTTVKD